MKWLPAVAGYKINNNANQGSKLLLNPNLNR